METLQERRRKFVNREIAINLKGKKFSKTRTARVFKKAWKDAKRKIK